MPCLFSSLCERKCEGFRVLEFVYHLTLRSRSFLGILSSAGSEWVSTGAARRPWKQHTAVLWRETLHFPSLLKHIQVSNQVWLSSCGRRPPPFRPRASLPASLPLALPWKRGESPPALPLLHRSCQACHRDADALSPAVFSCPADCPLALGLEKITLLPDHRCNFALCRGLP